MVAGERVYITAYEGARRILLCIELRSGDRIWERSVEARKGAPIAWVSRQGRKNDGT